MDFQQKLRKLVLNSRRTTRDFSKVADLRPRTMSDWKADRIDIGWPRLQKIARVFGKRIDLVDDV